MKEASHAAVPDELSSLEAVSLDSEQISLIRLRQHSIVLTILTLQNTSKIISANTDQLSELHPVANALDKA